jgi:hypothetical protein
LIELNDNNNEITCLTEINIIKDFFIQVTFTQKNIQLKNPLVNFPCKPYHKIAHPKITLMHLCVTASTAVA